MVRTMARRLPWSVACVAALLAAPRPPRPRTTYTLIGHGWGHGIGMSQWGAYGYARHGWTYRQILAHYYTGTAIGQSPVGFTERVAMMDAGRPSTSARRRDEGVAEGDGTHAPACPPGRTGSRPGVTPATSGSGASPPQPIVLSGLAAPVKVMPGTAPLLLVEPSYRGFGNDHWHGQLRFLLSGGNVRPVNVVSLDNYARGIVPCEESSSWPIEALKAQAVAARSYAYRTRNTDPSWAIWDTKDDAANQTYCPIEREGAPRSRRSRAHQP